MGPKRAAERTATEIEAKLEIIKAKMWAKTWKADDDWRQDGDLNHVLELVKEIESFLD